MQFQFPHQQSGPPRKQPKKIILRRHPEFVYEEYETVAPNDVQDSSVSVTAEYTPIEQSSLTYVETPDYQTSSVESTNVIYESEISSSISEGVSTAIPAEGVETSVPNTPHATRHTSHPSHHKKEGAFFHGFKELLRAGTIAVVTFGIVMGAMNYTAYSSIAKYYIGQWNGTQASRTLALEKLISGNPFSSTTIREQAQLVSGASGDAPLLPKAGLDKPPLDIDITPLDNRMIIPELGVNAPIGEIDSTNLIKQNWTALEDDIQAGLLNGLVHYPGTALPSQGGNFFVTGHSSFYAWAKSKYKDVFALLPQLKTGDQIIVYYDQQKYVYEVSDIQVVAPTDTAPLKNTSDKRLTLMTCVPVGTDLKREIVTAKPVE